MTEYYKHIPLEFPDKDLRILRLRSGRPEDTITAEVIRMDPYNDSSDRQHHDKTFSRLPFEAMSWCWGQDGEQGKIKVMDAWQDETKLFDMSISPSLVEALRSLRYLERSRDLWIDRLCIDQDTVAEREIQVGRMPDVYSNAANVCVWLGIGDETSKAAFDFIREHVLQLRKFDLVTDLAHLSHWDGFIRLAKRPWFSRRWVVQEIALASKATVHCGFEYVDWRDFADAVALLDSVESAGRRLSAAAKKIPFEEYVDRFSEEISNLEAVKLVDALHALFRASPSTREPQATLEDLVHRLSSFEVSEPRGAVLSLMAIAKDFDPEPGDIMPGNVNAAGWKVVRRHKDIFQAGDFEEHIVTYEAQVLKVYAGLVDYVIRNADKGRALDIVCRPWAMNFTGRDEHPVSQMNSFDVDGGQATSQPMFTSPTAGKSERSSRLPSWIVSVNKAPFQKVREDTSTLAGGQEYQTWTRETADGLVGYPHHGVRGYSAAGTRGVVLRSFRLLRRQTHYSMFVEGFILDALEHVEAASQLGTIPGEWLKYSKWEKRQDEWDDPPDHKAWETFWRTLVADRDHHGRNAPPFFDRACKMVMRSESQNNTINTDDLMNHGFRKDRSEVVTRFLERVQRVIWNRHLVQTKAAHLGLGPAGTSKGDLVCILYGCSVPVILRRHLNEHTEDDAAYDQKIRIRKVAKAFQNAIERRRGKLAQREAAAGAPTQRKPGMAPVPGTGRSLPKTEPSGGKDETKYWYELIGEAYIHNMMNGEAIMWQNEDLATRRPIVFEIR
ncbi:hypothetical protein B0A48_03781 [Cryoendolithus antarcticus]|uniref:Heterokaryon incompatibility domain-containing protein n=1 Tax=Cryoendolithus antarcticus TaxID=1507870 RepID=A0A1V8TGT1_9PEZI|nr:hypothetical protein B0A48_03781 [Cryoendolithus antarcticus]